MRRMASTNVEFFAANGDVRKRWQVVPIKLLPKHVAVWRLRNDGPSDGGVWGI